MKKKFTFIFTIIFTTVMLTLTFSAREIKNNFMLPNVKVTRPVTAQYEEVMIINGGTEILVKRQGYAINKEEYDKIIAELGGIYVLETRQKNNEMRNYIKLIILQIKTETETDYIIESGLNNSDFYITESNRTLKNGEEVYVIN